MRINRPKSYIKSNNSYQNNFSKTSSGFYKINDNIENNSKKLRILSGNSNPLKYRPKLFSLLDINDKITNSRGTSLPIQFKRLTEEETQRQFGFSYREEHNHRLTLIRQFLNNIHPSKYRDNKNNTNQTEENDKNNFTKDNDKNINNNKLEIKIDNNNKNTCKKEIKNVDENKNEKISN